MSSTDSHPFIAELHDIGKLADREALESDGLKVGGHTYHEFDFAQLDVTSPSSPSWWTQWSDSIKSLSKTTGLPIGISDEGKGCIILTSIADTVAGSISRTYPELSQQFGQLRKDSKLVAEGLYLLWKPTYYEEAIKQGKHWAAFSTAAELKQMFTFIDQCISPASFFNTFSENLKLTSEDKSVPSNIIPLGTHLELTGKVFRVLRKWSSLVDDNGTPRIEYNRQKIENDKEAAGDRVTGNNKGKWVFRLIQCHIRFPQSLVRIQDLNVVRLRKERVEEIVKNQKIEGDEERQPYAVIFHTDDFLSLFLPIESVYSLSQVVQPLLDEGFWLEYEELESELNLLTSTGQRTREQLIQKYESRGIAKNRRQFSLRLRAMWPDLAETITPPLCDLCQQRGGKEYIKDQIREWLCPICRKIREMGEPATAISDWEEQDKPVAWLKISLDQDLLLQCLKRLFEDYVDNGPNMYQVQTDDKEKLKIAFRPLAAQVEFTHQYNEFLEGFQSLLNGKELDTPHTSLNIEPGAILYPIQEYRELIVVRLDDTETIGLILDAFNFLLERYFPECLEDCPIRLSVSLSNIKYPYHQHWQFFEEKQTPGILFSLQQPDVRQLQLTAQQFQSLREQIKGDKISHFLHGLATTEAEAGEIMAMMQALGRWRDFPQLQILLWQRNLSFTQLLDYYRLVGSTNIRENSV